MITDWRKTPFERRSSKSTRTSNHIIHSTNLALGITATELEGLLSSKTMPQILEDKNIDVENFRSKMMASADTRWKSRGFSQEQIEERLAEREQRHAANSN